MLADVQGALVTGDSLEVPWCESSNGLTWSALPVQVKLKTAVVAPQNYPMF